MESRDSHNKDDTPSCSKEANSPTKDKLFDPSIDMLVNDFDDERTLEEEEALAAGEASDPSAELSNLEKEGNMPLDELLALYGYNTKEKDSSSESDEAEEDSHVMEQDPICELLVEKPKSPTPPRHSKLSLLYESNMEDSEDTRNLTSVSRLTDDEDEDGDSNIEDDDYQKFEGGLHNIMVGNDYQAQVPDGLTNYEQFPANDNEDKLLWNPDEIFSQDVEDFLIKTRELFKPPIPEGNVLRDDEEALYILKECDYKVEEALQQLIEKGSSSLKVTKRNDTKWSEEECRNFESGVRSFGKDFLQIQQNKVQTKTVGELVQFYYLWKKTERHDVFANKCRLEKKKYSFHPGFTDFMDRFLDDQDVENRNCLSGKALDS
ncbi:hypothetical protein ABEB36_011153 [Hypothenemus hampei]|uniref:Mesoderm induction early response protein 1 n=1 Tax=Hypothenemus hampei TaxID=57062 RepID=A0ABD1EGE7_HYPHA